MKPDEFVSKLANRRNFLKGAGIAGIGLATATLAVDKFGAGEQKVEAASSYGDAEILNFALNLEYLEAEFYLMATYGTTLVKSGILKSWDESGPTTGGNKVPNFSTADVAYIATALRTDEVAHVLFLRSALGSAAVKKPAIDLSALGYGFASVHSFLELSRQFEDVGVSAYLGAAPYVTNKTYLSAAGAILGTEAQHSGAIRHLCIMNGVSSPAVDSLDVPPTASHPFDVNSNAMSIPRTFAQVLNIVYHGGNCSGGFYPDGMNGSIVCRS